MSDPAFSSSQSGSQPTVWISKHEALPDTCISCGMFTDQRVAVRFVQQEQMTVAASEVNSTAALGCLLHLLGIGWLLALMDSGSAGNKTTQKTVKSKGKIKVPQCRLCSGHQVPQPVDGNVSSGKFALEVHPGFMERLKSMRDQAGQQGLSS